MGTELPCDDTTPWVEGSALMDRRAAVVTTAGLETTADIREDGLASI